MKIFIGMRATLRVSGSLSGLWEAGYEAGHEAGVDLELSGPGPLSRRPNFVVCLGPKG